MTTIALYALSAALAAASPSSSGLDTAAAEDATSAAAPATTDGLAAAPGTYDAGAAAEPYAEERRYQGRAPARARRHATEGDAAAASADAPEAGFQQPADAFSFQQQTWTGP